MLLFHHGIAFIICEAESTEKQQPPSTQQPQTQDTMGFSKAFPSFALLIVLPILLVSSAVELKQTYIVHMKHQDKPLPYGTHHDWLSSQLQSLSGSDSSLLYSYTEAFYGFAAKLDSDQAESLRRSDLVISVYEDTLYHLHTTHTPEFLGLYTETSQNTQYLEQASHDVIIGVLDTGIWPESKSFDDSGLPDIPTHWRGECESGPDFRPKVCNKKLIGARSFSKGYQMATGGRFLKKAVSPRDQDGHGTHTASTAAGSPVSNASFFGYASGTARGMATHARVAMYKVCWNSICFGSDILAALDWAINDGVDVLSLSIGGGPAPYFQDPIAIGAFTAVERGIFVSCSAGNSGPMPATVINAAPWIMTVGAGTLDRDFPAFVSLGNKNQFTGASLYSGQGMGNKQVRLVYKNGRDKWRSSLCLPGSLEQDLVRGKVVVCDRGVNSREEKGEVVRDAGGVGMIIANGAANGEELVANSHLLPSVAVGCKAGDLIKKYVRSDRNPTALLTFGGTVLHVRPSPMVAAFSSRGPNMVIPYILKPDVIGPGVNILAAWPEAVGPTGLDTDTRKTQFNIVSGTSMSCPHISGLAALLKAAHPQWSPSTIKSALMTTAYTQDNTKSPLQDAAGGAPSNPWAHGAGHVDPHKALSPGLIYDISTEDYITFLCSLDYTVDQVQTIVKRSNVTCSRKFFNPGELNYPSFSVLFENNGVVQYTRVLTNVGAAWSVYHVTVNAPTSVAIIVEPPTLFFGKVGDKQSYTITFVAKGVGDASKSEFGSIVWSNTQHQVKSPVTFQWTVVKSKSITFVDSFFLWAPLIILGLLIYFKCVRGHGNRPRATPPSGYFPLANSQL